MGWSGSDYIKMPFRCCPYYLYGEARYPDYINGFAYVMPTLVARDLYKELWNVPIFHLEDVYIGNTLSTKSIVLKTYVFIGLVSERIGISPKHDARFHTELVPIDVGKMNHFLAVHRFKPQKMLFLFNRLKYIVHSCS